MNLIGAAAIYGGLVIASTVLIAALWRRALKGHPAPIYALIAPVALFAFVGWLAVEFHAAAFISDPTLAGITSWSALHARTVALHAGQLMAVATLVPAVVYGLAAIWVSTTEERNADRSIDAAPLGVGATAAVLVGAVGVANHLEVVTFETNYGSLFSAVLAVVLLLHTYGVSRLQQREVDEGVFRPLLPAVASVVFAALLFDALQQTAWLSGLESMTVRDVAVALEAGPPSFGMWPVLALVLTLLSLVATASLKLRTVPVQFDTRRLAIAGGVVATIGLLCWLCWDVRADLRRTLAEAERPELTLPTLEETAAETDQMHDFPAIAVTTDRFAVLPSGHTFGVVRRVREVMYGADPSPGPEFASVELENDRIPESHRNGGVLQMPGLHDAWEHLEIPDREEDDCEHRRCRQVGFIEDPDYENVPLLQVDRTTPMGLLVPMSWALRDAAPEEILDHPARPPLALETNLGEAEHTAPTRREPRAVEFAVYAPMETHVSDRDIHDHGLEAAIRITTRGHEVSAAGGVVPPVEHCESPGPTICLLDDGVDVEQLLEEARRAAREGRREVSARLLEEARRAYDWEALFDMLREFKGEYPDEEEVRIAADLDIPVQLWLRTLATAVQPAEAGDNTSALFDSPLIISPEEVPRVTETLNEVEPDDEIDAEPSDDTL